jgi:hypothetical protein
MHDSKQNDLKLFLDVNRDHRSKILSDQDPVQAFYVSIEASLNDPVILDLIKWRLFGDIGYKGVRLISAKALLGKVREEVIGSWRQCPKNYLLFTALFSESLADIEIKTIIQQFESLEGSGYQEISKFIRLLLPDLLMSLLADAAFGAFLTSHYLKFEPFVQAKILNAIFKKRQEGPGGFNINPEDLLKKLLAEFNKESDAKGSSRNLTKFLTYFSSSFWADNSSQKEIATQIRETVSSLLAREGDANLLSIFQKEADPKIIPESGTHELIDKLRAFWKKRQQAGLNVSPDKVINLFSASELGLSRGLMIWVLSHHAVAWGDLVKEFKSSALLILVYKLARQIVKIRGLALCQFSVDIQCQVIGWGHFQTVFFAVNSIFAFGFGAWIFNIKAGLLWGSFVILGKILATQLRLYQASLLEKNEYPESLDLFISFAYLEELCSLVGLIVGACWLSSFGLLQWVSGHAIVLTVIYYLVLQYYFDFELSKQGVPSDSPKKPSILPDGSDEVLPRGRSLSISGPPKFRPNPP